MQGSSARECSGTSLERTRARSGLGLEHRLELGRVCGKGVVRRLFPNADEKIGRWGDRRDCCRNHKVAAITHMKLSKCETTRTRGVLIWTNQRRCGDGMGPRALVIDDTAQRRLDRSSHASHQLRCVQSESQGPTGREDIDSVQPAVHAPVVYFTTATRVDDPST